MIQDHNFILNFEDPEEIKQLIADTLEVPLLRVHEAVDQALEELKNYNATLVSFNLVMRCGSETWQSFWREVTDMRERHLKILRTGSIRVNLKGEMNLCE